MNRYILRNPGCFCLVLLLAAAGCGRRPAQPEGALEEARQLMQTGDFGTARDVLLQACADQPQSVTATVNLAMAYWKLGDLTAAADALNRATELAPQDPQIRELQAHLLIQTGNQEGATEVLGTTGNQRATTLTLRALAEQQGGNPDLALHHLEQALKRDRYYAPALHNIAILQRDQFDAPIEAMAAWRRFRETDPQNPRATLTTDAFLAAGTGPAPVAGQETPVDEPPTEAGPVTGQAAEILPPPPTDTTETVVTPPVSPVVNRPPDPPPREQPEAPDARALIEQAKRESADGNNDTALVTLKKAVQRYPDNADAVWALAVFYDRQLGLKDRANGLYKTFLDMFPNDPRTKSIRLAPPPTRRKTEPPPTDASPNFFQKGLEHYSRQEWDAAIAAYRQALSMDPGSESCAYNLGLAYKARNDLDAAAAAFRHALSINPDMIKSLYMLGLTEIQRKRNADALGHLNRLIRVQPDFAKAHYLLGTVYQTENQPDTAAHHFERFLELDPDDKAAEQVKRWLSQHRR